MADAVTAAHRQRPKSAPLSARNSAPSAPPIAGEIAALIAELEQVPGTQEPATLAERRFHRRDLVAELLRLGQAGLRPDAARSERLGLLAFVLSGKLDDGAALVPASLARALLLIGTARRLQGKLEPAASSLERGNLLLARPEEEAALLRDLGLVRWEQGRMGEAAALLAAAAEDFAEAEAPASAPSAPSAAVCLALAGVLWCEEGNAQRSLAALVQAGPALADPTRSNLALRGHLALALSRAQLGDHPKSHAAIEASRRLAEGVEDCEAAWLAVTWAQGRVAARLGEPKEADRHLQPVRAKLFAAGRLPEAALVTLDLALVSTLRRRADGIDPLIEGLASRFLGRSELALALPPLVGFEEAASQPGCDAQMAALQSARLLRRMFRGHGVRLEPPPYP